MLIFDLLAAFFTAVLSGTGVGGGGLFVIYLTLVRHTPQLEAQGTNLAFFLASALSSMLWHIPKRKMRWRLILFAGLFGALGGLCGAWIAKMTAMTLLSKCFGGFLLFCGLRSLLGKVKK